ncbi:MAG: hypothetical protein LBE71_02175, partial [Dysgonamonadaceae bacterium]|nr:hypothetical protein [Dysgonamonadaceae bacterium]
MKKLLIVFLVTLFFMGCDQDSPVKDTTFEEPSEQGAQQSLGLGWRPDFSIENRAMRPTILGRQKQNPFSVQNMRIALDTVFAYAQEAEDALLQSDLQIGISSLVGTSSLNALSVNAFSLDATDLYVRFLPQDSVGYDLLMQDHTLELFNHPLDYEILQAGDYYVDPSLEGSLYSWQYAVVKPNYQPPQGVIYEILDELFLIENCEGYSEQITGTFRKVLTATSFAFTGNESELRIGSPELAGFITTCKKTCILWGAICWTTCDTRYYPEGYIKVNTPSGEKPLKGIKVRTSRWFKNITMRTDANGYYSTNSAYYDDILIGNCPLYEIVFDGVNGDNSWELN